MDMAVVRAATEGDLDLLVEQTWEVAAEGVWIGLEVPFDRSTRRDRYRAQILAPSSTVLVADATPSGGPPVVGHIAPYGVADIAMLLTPDWRGKGLGRTMLQAAIHWATGSGAHKMWLEAWPHNTAAIELYRREGFAVEGRKRSHYRRRNGELWDAVLMGRPLR